MAFLNACIFERVETSVHELATYALATAVRMNSTMVNVSPSAVMTSQNRTDRPTMGLCNEAHAWIPGKIRHDALSRISFAYADALALFPKGENIVVHVDCKRRYKDNHILYQRTASS